MSAGLRVLGVKLGLVRRREQAQPDEQIEVEKWSSPEEFLADIYRGLVEGSISDEIMINWISAFMGREVLGLDEYSFDQRMQIAMQVLRFLSKDDIAQLDSIQDAFEMAQTQLVSEGAHPQSVLLDDYLRDLPYAIYVSPLLLLEGQLPMVTDPDDVLSSLESNSQLYALEFYSGLNQIGEVLNEVAKQSLLDNPEVLKHMSADNITTSRNIFAPTLHLVDSLPPFLADRLPNEIQMLVRVSRQFDYIWKQFSRAESHLDTRTISILLKAVHTVLDQINAARMSEFSDVLTETDRALEGISEILNKNQDDADAIMQLDEEIDQIEQEIRRLRLEKLDRLKEFRERTMRMQDSYQKESELFARRVRETTPGSEDMQVVNLEFEEQRSKLLDLPMQVLPKFWITEIIPIEGNNENLNAITRVLFGRKAELSEVIKDDYIVDLLASGNTQSVLSVLNFLVDRTSGLDTEITNTYAEHILEIIKRDI